MGGKYARAKDTDIRKCECVDMYVKCEYVLSVLLSSLRLTNTFLCSFLNRSIVCLSVDVCEGVYLCGCVYMYVCMYVCIKVCSLLLNSCFALSDFMVVMLV